MKIFFKKIALILAGTFSISMCAYANLPVMDASNLIQNTTTALKTAAMVDKQIQQYELQAQQYKNMVQNTLNPTAFIWNQSDSTIQNLLRVTDTLTQYENQNGGTVNSYFEKYYKNVHNYRNLPCFKAGQCAASDLQALQDASAKISQAEQDANKAQLANVEQQQKSLTDDAAKLVNLQQQASSATGQLAAEQAGNQLVSAQAHQLLQVRALLVAQQTAQATRQAAIANKEAIQQAADESFRAGTFIPSPPSNW